jgi:hypothetical protein
MHCECALVRSAHSCAYCAVLPGMSCHPLAVLCGQAENRLPAMTTAGMPIILQLPLGNVFSSVASACGALRTVMSEKEVAGH